MIIQNCKYLVLPSIDLFEAEEKTEQKAETICFYSSLSAIWKAKETDLVHNVIEESNIVSFVTSRSWNYEDIKNAEKNLTNQNDCTLTKPKKNRYLIRRIARIWPKNATMRKQQ